MSEFNAADIPQNEVKGYRDFVRLYFHFKFEEGSHITSHYGRYFPRNTGELDHLGGYQLFLTHDNSAPGSSDFDPEDATTNQLRGFRTNILTKEYQDHPFFSLDNAQNRIQLVVFEAYMEWFSGAIQRSRSKDSTPFSSRAPSQADTEDQNEGRMSTHSPQQILELESSSEASSPLLKEQLTEKQHRTKGKGKSKKTNEIMITQQLSVNTIIDISTVPSSWTVPRTSTAYRVDLSASKELLTSRSGKIVDFHGLLVPLIQTSFRY
ncbi:hypothetical protein C8J57DRAFT_1213130 [Mycena rebaudengoi]|nr:hypothetical protein C8J57DRAFT_1213130 [Mycena rebaudengoi]